MATLLQDPLDKPLHKILRLYIKPRRIVILSGYPPIFPPNTAIPRNPCDANIQTWLRDVLPRGDLSSEAERAEVLQIRIHARRLAVGWLGGLEPAFRAEGFRVWVEIRFTVNSPLVRVDVCSGVQEEGGLGFSVSGCEVVHIIFNEQMWHATCCHKTSA